MPLTTVDQGLLSTNAQYTGFKNRIINGDMVIDQRNNGASINLSNTTAYLVDRWETRLGTSTGSTAVRSTTAPAGFTNSVLLTIGTGATPSAGTGSNYFNQKIEGFNVADLGWGTANAQTLTLSFWVRSSLTGNFGVCLTNDAINPSYPTSYTISAANTWEYKTITVPGPTSGTFATNNTGSIRVIFDWGNGSDFKGPANSWANSDFRGGASGTTNICATSGATWFITGVQLEKGSTATSFDVLPYGTELALCQRYCEVLSSATGTLGGVGSFITSGVCENTTRVQPYYTFKVQKRAGPSVTLSAIGTFGLRSTTSSVVCTSGNFGAPGAAFAQGEFNNGGGGLIAGGAGWLTNHDGNAQIIWSAEL
jgi:hypothetical protein